MGRTQRRSEPDRSKGLRTDYVATFLNFFETVAKVHCKDLKTACGRLGSPKLPQMTVRTHLKNVAMYFLRDRKATLTKLFTVEGKEGERRVRPTLLGTELHKHLVILNEQLLRTSRLARRFSAELARPHVRVGASRTIGLRLLPSILSGWEDLFGSTLTLEVEIGNTSDLVDRLIVGSLDFIVSYGEKAEEGLIKYRDIEVDGRSVGFRPFDYSLQLVLVCDQRRKPPLKDGKELKESDGNLPDLDIRTIDFSQTNLIVSKSWWRQPDKLQALMRQLQDEGRLQEVRWFQEGVALARMNLGVAIVSEVYSKEDHLAAFALTPHEEFKRWIGIYYRSDKSLSSEACRVASLIEDYVHQNEAAIRNGRPPPLDDPFRKKWQVFNKTREWDKEATSRYPARPAQVTKPIRKRGR